MTSDTINDSVTTLPSPALPSMHKATEGTAAGAAAKVPTIIDNICSRSVDTISTLFSTFFEQIDDAFFDLADTARNNNEQNVHFESMREIRLQRKQVEQTFFCRLKDDFHSLTSKTTPYEQTPPSNETLSLLNNDDMEIDVAVNSMVSRVRKDLPSLLLQLNTRFSDILRPTCIDEDNNPLDPQQIVQHFAFASEHFQLELQARLILFKQFDRLVLRQYEPVLLEANQILIGAGILPNLRSHNLPPSNNKLSPLKSTPETSSPEKSTVTLSNNAALTDSSSSEPAPTSRSTPSTFDSLQSLLASTAPPPSSYIDPQQPIASQHEIFSLLDSIQRSALSLLSQTDNLSTAESLQVSENLTTLLKQKNGPQPSLDRVDTDIINIVDMIFEYILTQNLPAPMTLLISKLQIPVLKSAIRDRAFFNTNRHPARRLLNLIGHSCLGWDHNTTPESDKLYQQVESTVQHIIEHYSDDVQIFENAEKDLLAYIEQTEKRAKKLEERTIAAEEGKAKTTQAKQLTQQLLRDRIQGKALPPVVIEYLKYPWQRLLLQTILKDGTSSDDYRTTLRIADDLMWSVLPQQNEDARKRWLAIVPTMLQHIKNGLDRVAYNSADTEKIMSQLWDIHSKMLKHKGTDNPLHTVTVDLTNIQSDTSTPNNSKIAARKAALDKATLNRLLREITHYKTGSWFEFIEPDTKPLRCKLTAKIRATESYVFVNRFGVKSKQLDHEELLLALHENRVKALESGPIIDRALESISSKLKSSLP